MSRYALTALLVVVALSGTSAPTGTAAADRTTAAAAATWQQASPAPSPADGDVRWVREDDGWLGDTWVFDGDTWEQRTPPLSPPATFGTEMAYDAARGEVVMFGGGFGNDRTWVWDGTVWEEKHPVMSPPGRTGHGMAYDRSRQAVILYGGWSGTELSDTWSWNGETWTELDLQRSPGPLDGPAVSSLRQRVVLFGGAGPDGIHDETWKLRAGRWRQVAADPAPPPREEASLAYDSDRKEAVLFGGLGVVGGSLDYLGDTWLLQRWRATSRSARSAPSAG